MEDLEAGEGGEGIRERERKREREREVWKRERSKSMKLCCDAFFFGNFPVI